MGSWALHPKTMGHPEAQELAEAQPQSDERMQSTAQAVGEQPASEPRRDERKSLCFGAGSCLAQGTRSVNFDCANFLLHKSPWICYKQFTESSSVASRSYCLHLSGFVRHLSVKRA